MNLTYKQQPGLLWEKYSQRLTLNRKNRLLKAAQLRTKYIRLMLEDIHHPHNISACLRTAEALGILCVDIINLHEKFIPTSVAKGVDKWLDIKIYSSIQEYVQYIKKQNYIIAAAYPDPNLLPLEKIPVNHKIAVLFGNEHAGIDHLWDPHIDIKFTIPMCGLVESLNISVSCAITLRELSTKAKDLLAKEEYYISKSECMELLDTWILKIIHS